MAGLLLRLTSALLDKEWGGAPGRMLSGLATGGGDSFWGGWCFWGVGFLGEVERRMCAIGDVPLGTVPFGLFVYLFNGLVLEYRKCRITDIRNIGK